MNLSDHSWEIFQLLKNILHLISWMLYLLQALFNKVIANIFFLLVHILFKASILEISENFQRNFL